MKIDDVGVLLEAARLTEVGEHRALVLAVLELAVELRSAITGHSSSRARILRPREISDTSTWRFSMRRRRARRHELEVVDDDEPEVAVAGA